MYNDFYMTLYNVVFTSAAPLVVGMFDRDLDKPYGLRYPGLYKSGALGGGTLEGGTFERGRAGGRGRRQRRQRQPPPLAAAPARGVASRLDASKPPPLTPLTPPKPSHTPPNPDSKP